MEKVSAAEAEAYFVSRPRGSQIGAWASPQSRVIPDREFLEQKVVEAEASFAGKETLPLPPYWGGYRVIPTEIEFWQGRENRLHDRIVYVLQAEGNWLIERLAP